MVHDEPAERVGVIDVPVTTREPLLDNAFPNTDTRSHPTGCELSPSRDAAASVPIKEVLVVSDSEEERQRRVKMKRPVLANVNVNELRVIEISDSEDEDASNASNVACEGGSQAPQEGDVLSHIAGNTDIAHNTFFDTPNSVGPSRPHLNDSETRTPGCRPRRRLPLDDDIIDLTIPSPEPESPRRAMRRCSPSPRKSQDKPISEVEVMASMPRRSAEEALEDEGIIPLFADDSDDNVDGQKVGGNVPDDPFAMDDGSILVLNEPRSARKPARRAPRRVLRDSHVDSDDENPAVDSPAAPSPFRPFVAGARPAAPSPKPVSVKTPRISKKMLLQAKKEHLQAYAAEFFKELNEKVFGGGLPENTELVWSNRLLTTAGRANWRRDRDGRHITHIQLAEKILDCEERIRNTLSHEMCHLACWVISGQPEEQHGSIFKDWARKVMRKRSDVEITTRHNYEINHKYRWKCEDCGKVYGRHSKSINPEEHVCGACKGRLIPQFETAKRAPRTPKPKTDSQNAATRSRDSPLVMPGAFPASPALPMNGKAKETAAKTRVTIELSEDDDSDIEILAHTLKDVHIKTTEDA
ncbi:hypothetical protein PYCCODRAFT_1384846 [Trametes coccinea BRFM310]|uniref:SprT-like domain-containing protein n=1 Tax=Trametes coccinea (strain BRFM310) TaxID=1353009 RepID=A0A1Y2IXI6_TRAC3|nr:hypothetical protein PYCCODRAFT_1384846 [Trametes coccinea BRFM310]